MQKQLEAGLAALNVSLSAQQCQSLQRYVELLDKWGRVYNLTAIREKSEMVSRHLLDSLALLPWIDGAVVDLGSGAGLPVIPLAIAKPQSTFTSIESNGKKTRFQQQAVLELKLSNVVVEQVRAESFQSQADVVVSRAFTAPEEFLGLAAPLCKSGGLALVMLGQAERMPDPVPEPFLLSGLYPLTIPGVSSQRHVAVCHKR